MLMETGLKLSEGDLTTSAAAVEGEDSIERARSRRRGSQRTCSGLVPIATAIAALISGLNGLVQIVKVALELGCGADTH